MTTDLQSIRQSIDHAQTMVEEQAMVAEKVFHDRVQHEIAVSLLFLMQESLFLLHETYELLAKTNLS